MTPADFVPKGAARGEATCMTEDGFDFEGAAQHQRKFRNSDPGSDDRGKRGLSRPCIRWENL